MEENTKTMIKAIIISSICVFVLSYIHPYLGILYLIIYFGGIIIWRIRYKPPLEEDDEQKETNKWLNQADKIMNPKKKVY